jgi:hypothetical protein
MSLEEYCVLESEVLKCVKKYGDFSQRQAALPLASIFREKKYTTLSTPMNLAQYFL